MKKELLTSICAIGLLVGANSAFAGSYGKNPEPEEGPTAPPAAPVLEEPAPDYASPGFYLGAGGNYAISMFSEHKTPDSDGVNRGGASYGNSSGFHVRAGYRIIPNLAVEALYERYSEFDRDSALGSRIGGGNLTGWSTTANVKGYVLTGRYQPYAVIGLGYLAGEYHDNNIATGSPSKDGFMMRFGVGLEGYITEHISMGPEVAYVLPFGSADNFDFMTVALGLRYKF